jgi:hypothetical protein
MDSMRSYIRDEFGNPSLNGGYGASLKNDIRRMYGSTVGMSGRGESIPQYDNFCEIDNEIVDKYGIPVLKFHYNWTEHEVKASPNTCMILLKRY